MKSAGAVEILLARIFILIFWKASSPLLFDMSTSNNSKKCLSYWVWSKKMYSCRDNYNITRSFPVLSFEGSFGSLAPNKHEKILYLIIIWGLSDDTSTFFSYQCFPTQQHGSYFSHIVNVLYICFYTLSCGKVIPFFPFVTRYFK